MLTRDEEQLLIRAAQAGDRNAVSTLVRSFEPLVTKYVRRFVRRPMGLFDDLVQIGRIALVHAVSKFEASRGLRFATYAHWWVRTYVDRARQRELRSRVLPPPVLVNDEPSWTPEDAVTVVQNHARAHALLATLSRNEAHVVYQYLNEMTFDEIGAALGVTRQAVTVTGNKGYRRLLQRYSSSLTASSPSSLSAAASSSR